MKTHSGSIFLFAVFACFGIRQIPSVFCQEFSPGPNQGAIIYGYTSIDYDPSTNTVTAYSETDTYDPYYYFVTTQLNSTGCSVERSSRTESTVAVECSFRGAEGETYNAYGHHIVGFFINLGGQFEDPYGLSYWPQYDIESPWQFPFTETGDGSISDLSIAEIGSTYDTVQTSIPTTCGDQRDTIISEYVYYGTPYIPTCSLFTQNTEDPIYTFHRLNYGTYQWAILRSYFISALNQLADLKSFTVSSAYRNPAREAALAQASGQSYAPGSRHQYGDAVDIASNSSDWSIYQSDGHAIGACVEPVYVQGGSYAHAHLDWRTDAAAVPNFATCPPYW